MPLDASDVIALVGALLVAVGIYLQFGGAWVVIFVGAVLLITGLLSALSRARRKHDGADQ